MSSVAIIVACVFLAAAVVAFIFYIEPDASDSVAHRSRLDQLMDRRDMIYDNLRDLRFEYRAGKYSEKDYEEMKRMLEAEAARVLGEMDRVTGGAPSAATRQAMSRKPSSQ